jgi:hypothetical protein
MRRGSEKGKQKERNEKQMNNEALKKKKWIDKKAKCK